MATALTEALRDAGAEIIHSVDANMIFARLTPSQTKALRDAGAAFHPSMPDGEGACRLVTSWATTVEEIEAMKRALKV